MQEVLVLLIQRSTRSGTASMCLGDSRVSVTRGPDSDKPVETWRDRRFTYARIEHDMNI